MISWGKFFSIVLFAGLIFGLAFGVNLIKTRAATTGTDLQISALMSSDSDRTWVPSTEPICVRPNEPVTMLVRVWNTGTETADIVHGNGTLTNNQYVDSTLVSGDCDNDGRNFTANPLTQSFDLTKVASLGSEYNGEQCAKIRVTPRSDTPCDQRLEGTITLTRYVNGKDDSAAEEERLAGYFGRALAALNYNNSLVQTTPTIIVNRDNCPRTCDDRGGFKKTSSATTSTTTLPQTGNTILDLIKF